MPIGGQTSLPIDTMRAHTAESLRKVRAAADTIRPRKGFKTREELPVLGVGEALVSVIGEGNVPSEVEKIWVKMPIGKIGPISDMEREAIIAATPLRQKYHAAGADHEAAHRFNRRMIEVRGIDPGPDSGVQPYEPNLYLKHIPTIDISASRPSVTRQLVKIGFWAGVALSGAALAGWL